MSRRRGGAAALVLAVVTVLVACGPSKEARERDRIVHALDAMRDGLTAPDVDGGASNDALAAKRRLVDALASQPADQPKAALARDACVEAYRPMLEAEEIQIAVRDELAGGADPSAPMYARLLEAETHINRSAAAMPACESASVALRLAR